MVTHEATVFVVDDDAAVRDSLRWLLESASWRVKTFDSVHNFLSSFDASCHGCLVLDVRMPGMSGLEFLDLKAEYGVELPVIVLTGHGDVPMAVLAMKRGAVEFLQKPADSRLLMKLIGEAMTRDAQRISTRSKKNLVYENFHHLTPREAEVARLIAAGKIGKAIAEELGISFKTVETHRSNIMRKMKAHTIGELISMMLSNGLA